MGFRTGVRLPAGPLLSKGGTRASGRIPYDPRRRSSERSSDLDASAPLLLSLKNLETGVDVPNSLLYKRYQFNNSVKNIDTYNPMIYNIIATEKWLLRRGK